MTLRYLDSRATTTGSKAEGREGRLAHWPVLGGRWPLWGVRTQCNLLVQLDHTLSLTCAFVLSRPQCSHTTKPSHVAPPTSRLTHSFLTCNTPTFPQAGPNHLLPPFLFWRIYCPYLLLSVEVGFLCEGVFTLEPHGLPCPAATTLCIGADSRWGGFQGRRSPFPRFRQGCGDMHLDLGTCNRR